MPAVSPILHFYTLHWVCMENDVTQQLHQRADTLLNSNNLAEARNLYLQIFKLDDQDAEACMMLGAIEGELGRINDAMQYLREAIRIRPDYADPHHTLAHLLVHQEKLTEACETLARAVEVDPAFVEAWEMLGGLQGQMGNFEGAEHSCRKVLQLDDSLLNSRMNLANALMEQGKDEGAITEFRCLTDRQPSLAPAWSRLGTLLARHGQPRDAIQALTRALQFNPEDHESRQTLAYALAQIGDCDAAIPLLQEAVELDVDSEACWQALRACYGQKRELDAFLAFCDAQIEKFPARKLPVFMKGLCLEVLNEPAAALGCYRHVTDLAPDWPAGWSRAGLLQLAQGDLGPAEQCLKKSLSLGMDDPAVHCACAHLKLRRGRPVESEQYGRRALEKAPDSPRPYCELGAALTAQGRLEEAMDIIGQGLAVAPDYPDLVVLLAEAHERKGEYEAAAELIQRQFASGRREPVLVRAYAVVSRKLGQGEKALQLVEQVLSSPAGLSNPQRAKLHFSAADLYDDAGEPDKAIVHYHRANELFPASFNQQGFGYLVDETIRVFNRTSLRKLSLFGNPSERPVFLVGMPGSGTSLLEQILATHPDVFGAGELQEIRGIAMERGLVPQNTRQRSRDLEAVRPEEISKSAKRYLDAIDSLADGQRRVVDKMSSNFLALGLIQVLFPNARVIHAMRNPMDTCLTCYFNEFGSSNGFAYSLDDLGFYYAEYARLMKHWQQVLSLDILDVQYEDLVSDQTAETRRMLEFCGLDWGDRALCYDQVRPPMYTSSVDRWHAYEAHLGSLKARLEHRDGAAGNGRIH